MPEQRLKQVMCNLEWTFYSLMQTAIAKREKKSASTYLRDLLIADLVDLGLVDGPLLIKVLVGDVPQC